MRVIHMPLAPSAAQCRHSSCEIGEFSPWRTRWPACFRCGRVKMWRFSEV